MRHLVIAIALAVSATSAMAVDLRPTESNCSISYINRVAMDHGVAKATKLSKACMAKGYNASKDWLKEKTADGAKSAKKTGSAGWDFVKEKSSDAKDAAGDLANKGLEKAAELKDKLFK